MAEQATFNPPLKATTGGRQVARIYAIDGNKALISWDERLFWHPLWDVRVALPIQGQVE